MLTKTQTRTAIDMVLRKVQGISGRECPTLTDKTKPIGDLDGFDSLTGLEATLLLEHELNVAFDDPTVFVGTSRSGQKRALTVAEIVERVIEVAPRTKVA